MRGASVTFTTQFLAHFLHLTHVLPREAHVEAATGVKVELVGAQGPPCFDEPGLLCLVLETAFCRPLEDPQHLGLAAFRRIF